MGAGPPAARDVARPEGGDASGPGTPPAVGAGCAGAVGSSPADPLYAAGPPGVHRAPRAGHGVHTPRHREVYPTQYSDVVQVIVPPTVYETVQALGYHRLGDMYTKDHRVTGERALKVRAPARKGIPGLGAWLALHGAVLAPLLRVPPPRWQAAPKDWIPGAVPAYLAEVVIGGRVAKTTRMETVYHRGYPIKVTTAMKDTMEAKDWAPELRVCCQPPDALPSDTRLHRLLVALLGVQVQVNAPLHAQPWDDHHHVSLDHLRSSGVWAPTIVWMFAPPADAYWQWAQASPVPLVTVTTALPPWIAIAPAAVAKFKYPAECVAHRCPGHPNTGPLCYSLGTAGTVPAELGPALRTHLREHHGDLALLAPHGLATDPLRVLAPEVKPGIWFHDLPALATLRGTVAAVDAGTHIGRHGYGGSRPERARGLPDPCGLRGGHLLGGGGHDTPLVRPQAGATAGGILAGAGLRGGGGGPPYVPGGRPLWRWHTPPLRHCPRRRAPLPDLGHQRGNHAVALDNGPERPS